MPTIQVDGAFSGPRLVQRTNPADVLVKFRMKYFASLLILAVPSLLGGVAHGQTITARLTDSVSQNVMPPPSGTTDYTATLVLWMSKRTSADEPRDLIFLPGEYHFYGPLDTSSEIWDAFSWSSAPAAGTRQHRPEGGNRNEHARRVHFVIHLDSEDDVWMDIQRPTYRFGPISITGNMAFTIVDEGSLFRFGDPEEDDQSVATMRGLRIEADLDRTTHHYGSLDTGDGREWLIDDATHGFLFNRTNQSFGLSMHHCYDVRLDINAWGLKYAVINHACDHPRGSIMGLSCGRTLLEYGASVNSVWTDVWEENPVIGSCFTGHITDFRGETNPTATPETGIYALPSSVDWDITAGDDHITFSSWDGAYDARDYFEPYTVIRLDPSESGEPDRWLLITAVAANEVDFFEANAKSYVSRDISGTGASCYRYFGIPGIAYDSRFDVASLSSISNIASIPWFAAAPGLQGGRIAGNTAGRGTDPNSAQETLIIGSSIGIQEGVAQSGVDIVGLGGRSNHPLVNRTDIAPPRFDRRTRECIYVPANPVTGAEDYWIAEVGRGVSTINDTARDSTFHPLTEANGEAVWGYRPSDGDSGWQIFDSRLEEATETTVHARVYSAAGATPSCYGGAGATETDTASAGWDDVTFVLEASQVDAAADGGTFVQLGGTDYYVTRVWITQD